MHLSVVIVNYNVCHFLDQCLHSLFQSQLGDIDLSVWVVDNNSDDESVTMVREKYPQVHLIANTDNQGFSRANNQALREILNCESRISNKESHTSQSTIHNSQFILILNPDTLVESDTLRQCVYYMQAHPECGGLGVKMVNAQGEFLRESKRGFPSPSTSFYKICGLSRLFPRHPQYAAYYMGHLDDDTVNEVDILPGAFLMTRDSVLRQVGLFDESYFMYAEDVDLSWRIHEAGYKNIYFPKARILHYKGESTQKESLGYVYTFYHAMAIFTRHYFGGKRFSAKALLLQLGIWLRASLAWMRRIVGRLLLPIIDLLFSWAGFVIIKNLWATYLSSNIDYYPSLYTWLVLPLYSLILLATVYLNGGYDKPLRPLKIAQGVALGGLALLAFYSLLDESMRYSRAIVLLGSLWTFVSTLLLRGLLRCLHVPGYNRRSQRHRRYLIIGGEEQQHRVFDLLGKLGIEPKSVITTPRRLSDTTQTVDEVVFCAQDVPLRDILDDTAAWPQRRVNFRIVPATDDVLLGSNYTECPENLYIDNFVRINSISSRRNKRLFDVVAAVLFLPLSPLLFWIQKDKSTYFSHCWQVLRGRRTWVGYHQPCIALPSIRPGILSTRDRLPHVKNPDTALLDQQYAQHYRIATDFTILLLNLNRL